MQFDVFPDPLKAQFVAGLAAPLRSLLEDTPELNPDAAYTWHESCRVVTLDLPEEFSVEDPISGFIRDEKVLWHHQIKVNGQPLLYARSIVEHQKCRLIKLVRSEIAQRFDATLNRLEGILGNGTIRLLLIPRYNSEIFALFQDNNILGFVPLQDSEEWSTHEFVGPPFSTNSLLMNLQGRLPFRGLRSA